MSDKAFDGYCKKYGYNNDNPFLIRAWHASGEYHPKKAIKRVIEILNKSKTNFTSENYEEEEMIYPDVIGAIKKKFGVKNE